MNASRPDAARPDARSADHRTRRARRAGFTLVELMVVVVIIGLLATVVAINVLPSQDRAMVEKARADIAVLETAVETYRLDNLTFPSASDGLRGARLAVTCDADFAPLLAEGRPIAPVEDPDVIEAMLIAAALTPPLNLLGRGRNDRAEGWRAWRRTAGLAAAVLISPLVLMAAEAIRDDLAAQALDRRSTQIVRAAWPDAPPGADPAAEVRRRGASTGLSGKARALFAALEPMEGAELDAMTLGRDGALRAVVSHPDYADIEALAASLSEAGLSLREDSTEEHEGRIVSDVVIEGVA